MSAHVVALAFVDYRDVEYRRTRPTLLTMHHVNRHKITASEELVTTAAAGAAEVRKHVDDSRKPDGLAITPDGQ